MKKISLLMIVALFAATMMTNGCFSKREVVKANTPTEGEKKEDDSAFPARRQAGELLGNALSKPRAGREPDCEEYGQSEREDERRRTRRNHFDGK